MAGKFGSSRKKELLFFLLFGFAILGLIAVLVSIFKFYFISEPMGFCFSVFKVLIHYFPESMQILLVADRLLIVIILGIGFYIGRYYYMNINSSLSSMEGVGNSMIILASLQIFFEVLSWFLV